MTEAEFVEKEWKEKADRRNPELRKWRESIDFDIRITGCSLCGDADCWDLFCRGNSNTK
tara:strand:+ start:2116 stop:2292 length:177 start_codon:yes stop_codon:yes gene_type:complete